MEKGQKQKNNTTVLQTKTRNTVIPYTTLDHNLHIKTISTLPIKHSSSTVDFQNIMRRDWKPSVMTAFDSFSRAVHVETISVMLWKLMLTLSIHYVRIHQYVFADEGTVTSTLTRPKNNIPYICSGARTL